MNLYQKLNRILRWVEEHPNRTAQEIQDAIKSLGVADHVHTPERLMSKLYTDGEIYPSGTLWKATFPRETKPCAKGLFDNGGGSK